MREKLGLKVAFFGDSEDILFPHDAISAEEFVKKDKPKTTLEEILVEKQIAFKASAHGYKGDTYWTLVCDEEGDIGMVVTKEVKRGTLYSKSNLDNFGYLADINVRAPSIQDLLTWLKEEHNIEVSAEAKIDPNFADEGPYWVNNYEEYGYKQNYWDEPFDSEESALMWGIYAALDDIPIPTLNIHRHIK